MSSGVSRSDNNRRTGRDEIIERFVTGSSYAAPIELGQRPIEIIEQITPLRIASKQLDREKG